MYRKTSIKRVHFWRYKIYFDLSILNRERDCIPWTLYTIRWPSVLQPFTVSRRLLDRFQLFHERFWPFVIFLRSETLACKHSYAVWTFTIVQYMTNFHFHVSSLKNQLHVNTVIRITSSCDLFYGSWNQAFIG